LETQRDDIHEVEANENLQNTDADITGPIKCTQKRLDVFEIGIILPGRSELCSRAVPTSATARLRLKCDGTRAETRFGLSAERTSPFKSAGGVSSVDYWQASCAHQPAGFVLLVQARVLQSCDAYWSPTPFSCFPFTSPPMRHRVPLHFKSSLPQLARHRLATCQHAIADTYITEGYVTPPTILTNTALNCRVATTVT
jgi:hypothetical protein